jgi:hypothetical protein
LKVTALPDDSFFAAEAAAAAGAGAAAAAVSRPD